MGLMQFLAVGRSVDRIQDHPTRYKMSQQNLLPKFCAVKADDDVDRAEAKPVAAPGMPFGAEKLTGVKLTLPVAGSAPSQLKSGIIKRVLRKLKFRKFMQTVAVKIKLVSSSNETASPHAFPQGRWSALSKSSLFRNPFATSRKPRQARAPLQTELVLDSIKPVRNDLSDRDADTLAGDEPEKTSGPPAFGSLPAPGSVSAEDRKASASQPAWERVKTQLFGAEKT
jgi:hypothetical protein